VQDLIQLGADAIICSGTIPQVFVSGSMGEEAKVPVVFMASSPFLSGPFLVQMSYSETALVRCIADIVKSYNWRKVITIYEDDVFGSVSSSALLLSDALDAIGSELEYRAILPSANSISDPTRIVRQELNRTKSKVSTIYIILRISEALAPILFEEATSLGMMNKGYIWICGNDITALLDSSFTPSFISRFMQGLVGIRSYINETAPEYINFRSNFQQRFKNAFEKRGENSFDPSVYAVRAYDAVDTISRAAATSTKNKKTLFENLISSNFSGLSGHIRPTYVKLNEREGYGYSVFSIINVVGRSYREMGIWIEGTGFYENVDEFLLLQPSSEKLKSIVFWPGGPLTTPSGLRRLRVGVTATNATFGNFVSVKKEGNSTSYSGFCIDVFTATLNCLGYEVLYDFVSYNIDSYDDLVNKVYLKVLFLTQFIDILVVFFMQFES
jgi:glutamate receptor, ionotropic, plant